ncbi:MAG: OmpA family protein [Bacteroidota bacterium]|nr:OmpA family protein [Bacteroidota bacterium]
MNRLSQFSIVCLIIAILHSNAILSQNKNESLDGFWQSRITYECSWGWKDDGGSVFLSKQFGDSYKGMVFGGDVEISHWYNDEYNFEITGQSECIRKGKLKKTEFAGRIYLSGEWNFSGGNNAMWGTGLCCNGKLEIYRDITKDKEVNTTRQPPKGKSVDTATVIHSHFKLEAGKKFILKNVLFKLSSDELMPEAFSEIDHLASVMKENTKMIIQLEGHTDMDGPRGMNRKLSKKRVQQVKLYLMNRGVDKDRIKLKWFGEKKPLVKKGTVERRKVNRRVEVRILKT